MTFFAATPNLYDDMVTDAEKLGLDFTKFIAACEHIDVPQLFAQAKALDPKLLTLSREELDILNQENKQHKKEDINTTNRLPARRVK